MRTKRRNACAWCGGTAQHTFCRGCYGLVDGGTKQRFNQQIRLGAPRTALRLVLTKLEELKAGGVPVPERGGSQIEDLKFQKGGARP